MHLSGHSRCMQMFAFERSSGGLVAHADSDWAPDLITRKSTWLIAVEAVVSSADHSRGELWRGRYSINGQGDESDDESHDIAKDSDMDLDGLVRTDSAAAVGSPQRSGLGGRTCNVQVQFL